MAEKVNYRIIEGDYDTVDYEEFKKDYMDEFMPKKAILEKYDINHQKYLRYGRMVYRDTGFRRKAGVTPIGFSTNIREHRGRWRIDKQINGKRHYFGTYDSFDEAKKVRDYLIAHNWSHEAMDKARYHEV